MEMHLGNLKGILLETCLRKKMILPDQGMSVAYKILRFLYR